MEFPGVITVIMVVVTIIKMIQKGHGKTLVVNAVVLGCYLSFFIYIGMNMDGFDGIVPFLIGLGAAWVHLLVLFIVSLVISPKVPPKPAQSSAVQQRKPAQPRRQVKPRPRIVKAQAPATPVKRAKPVAEAKPKHWWEEDPPGGELAFEDD